MYPSLTRNTSQLFYTAPINKQSTQLRFMSTSANLTHVTNEGKAKMVDVSAKSVTSRTATAQALVKIGPKITKLIKENSMKKGDVLTIAEIAGITGAKKTSELIPLCHNISISSVKVTASLDEHKEQIKIVATVNCEGKTGVEMEALTGASIAALTVYDMCKAVSHNIVIEDICLISKTGGSRGEFIRENVNLKPYDVSPIKTEQVALGAV